MHRFVMIALTSMCQAHQHGDAPNSQPGHHSLKTELPSSQLRCAYRFGTELPLEQLNKKGSELASGLCNIRLNQGRAYQSSK